MDFKDNILHSRYFYLFVSLTAFFIVNPFLEDNHVSNFILMLFFLSILFFSLYSITNDKKLIFMICTLIILDCITYWYLIFIQPIEKMYLIHFIFNIIIFSIVTFSVIRTVSRQREITANTLFGAICGYLLIGFIWSFLYLIIMTIDPSSFQIHIEHNSIRARVDHFIYYSFETLTTLGYGDILAIKSIPRTFSWMEAALGQIYLAVWISQLVGLRIMQLNKSK